MSLLAGAAIAGAGMAINSWQNREAAEKNQEYYRENMQANFVLSQQAQRNAARNEVEGLRSAGLSPVLANGAAGAPQVTAQGGTQQPAQFDAANMLLMAQLRNIEADTVKTQQEALNLETIDDQNKLNYAHASDLDATLSKNMPILFKEMSQDTRYSDDMRKFFATAATDAEQEGSTVGGVQGLEKYLNMRIEQKEALVKEMASKFDWNLAVAKVDDPNLVKTLVRMPQSERENLLALSGKYMQEVATLAQTAETEVAKREEIGARIVKINREAQKILHDDNAQMSKEGDYSGLLWSFGSFLANSTVGMVKSGAMNLPK